MNDPQDEYKRFRVPDEDVRVYSDEVAVTQTRQFQRLFSLKQLGLAYLVYPAATHTRGLHSLQCLNEAQKILRALKVDDSAAKEIRMAALLHDIGHVPFSHTLEDEHSILDKHDRRERLDRALVFLKSELSKRERHLVDAAAPILYAIGADPGDAIHPKDWRADLIGNTVCADLLAYIGADAKWTGIEKRPGYYRIYDYFGLANNRLVIKLTKGGLRPDIVSAIVDLLDMRYALTERVFFHHGKCIASSMLARAARLCKLQERPDTMDQLLKMGDEQFLDYLEQSAFHNTESGAEQLIAGLRSRRLHKRIFKIVSTSRDAWDESRRPGAFCTKWRDSSEVERLLCQVEDSHKLPRGTLALWCPKADAGSKLARTHVSWDAADTPLPEFPVELISDQVQKHFPGVHKRVATIQEQYQDLWSFWVTMDRQWLGRAAAVVYSLEREIGIPCDPVFAKTYLRQIPGYEGGMKRRLKIDKVIRHVENDVDLSFTNGSLGTSEPPDADILTTAKAAIDKRIVPAERAEAVPTEGEAVARKPQKRPRLDRGLVLVRTLTAYFGPRLDEHRSWLTEFGNSETSGIPDEDYSEFADKVGAEFQVPAGNRKDEPKDQILNRLRMLVQAFLSGSLPFEDK